MCIRDRGKIGSHTHTIALARPQDSSSTQAYIRAHKKTCQCLRRTCLTANQQKQTFQLTRNYRPILGEKSIQVTPHYPPIHPKSSGMNLPEGSRDWSSEKLRKTTNNNAGLSTRTPVSYTHLDVYKRQKLPSVQYPLLSFRGQSSITDWYDKIIVGSRFMLLLHWAECNRCVTVGSEELLPPRHALRTF